MQVYVVGKAASEEGDGEIVGIFTDETVAVQLATGKGYFVGPLVLNTVYPEEGTEWPGLYFPDGPEFVEIPETEISDLEGLNEEEMEEAARLLILSILNAR